MYVLHNEVGTATRNVDKKENTVYILSCSLWNEIFGWKWNNSKDCTRMNPHYSPKTILTYGQGESM
jgi:hypothetical protein